RRRHPDGNSVELALELWQDKTDGLGGAGRGRDHRHGRGARPVEILVQRVERRLVAGIGVDRGHEPTLDPDRVVEHLGYRRKTVRGARAVRDDRVVLGQLVVVDAEDDGKVGTVGRGGDQHTPGTGGEVCRCLFLGGKDACALHRDVDAEILPGKLRRIALGGDLDGAVADTDRVAFDRDLPGKAAMYAVVAQQVCVGLHWTKVVHRNDFDVLASVFGDGTQDVAADAAKSIDGDADCHDSLPA